MTLLDVPVVRRLRVPEDPEAERIVLGTYPTLCSRDRAALQRRLTGNDFYNAEHAVIFVSLARLDSPVYSYDYRLGGVSRSFGDVFGRPDVEVVATVPGLTEALRAAGARYPARCMALMEQLPATERVASVWKYVERVVRAAVRRTGMNICADGHGGLGDSRDAAEVLHQQRAALHALELRLHGDGQQ